MKSEIQTGGIVLAGGYGSRMRAPKADLPFGPETMVERVVRLLATVVRPIVVVGAAEQILPDFGSHVMITRDEVAGRGPLQGLLAGLEAISEHAAAAYVTSCDCPLLAPAFVSTMIGQLGVFDAAVPAEGEQLHPLAGVYRTRLLPLIADLLAGDRRSLVGLLEQAKTKRVPVEQLRAVDPTLSSLCNLNHPDDYLAALAASGLQPDPVVMAALNSRTD